MPVDAQAVRAGSVSQSFLFTAWSARVAGEPSTGLVERLSEGRAVYARDTATDATDVPLKVGSLERHVPGGLVEIDPGRTPGVYRFGVPDEMLAPGASRALLLIRFPHTVIEPIEVDIVAFDPQDPVRLGLTALSPEARVAALRGAFPRLTAAQLDEVVALKEPD